MVIIVTIIMIFWFLSINVFIIEFLLTLWKVNLLDKMIKLSQTLVLGVIFLGLSSPLWFGRIEQRIINIIIIPPMKIIIRIKEIQLTPVEMILAVAFNLAPVNSKMHIFIGFFLFLVTQATKQAIVSSIDVIIFLSLFKVLTLEVKEFRKYCLFLLV